MTIEEIKSYMKKNKITYQALSDMTGLSISTVTKIFGGYAKYPRVDTMEAIERALGLQSERQFSEPASEIAESFVRDNIDLIQEKNFNDLTKLYRVMTVPQRMQAVAYIVGFLTHAGVNTQAIVGY